MAVKRYLSILNQSKRVALTSFAVILGVTVIAAMQKAPPSGYTTEGALTYNNPPVTFSSTSTQIQNLGKQLSLDILLADNVIKAVAERMKVQGQEIRQHATVKLPAPEEPPLIVVRYRDEYAKESLQTTGFLMEAMVQQSRIINNNRLQGLIQALKQRSARSGADLKAAEQEFDRSNKENEPERSRLQQRVKIKQELYNKIQATLADLEAAQSELASSLTLAKPPQIISQSYQDFFVTLSVGVLFGLLFSGGLIPLLGFQKERTIRDKAESDRLQAILFELLKENQGKITLLRFALETQLPAETAQKFLDSQARAFNATSEVSEEGGIHYNFHL